MPTQTVHVILNPKSGGGRGARLREEILRELGARSVSVVIHETRAAGHARDLAIEAVGAGASLVAAAGGDGTIHDVANGLLSSEKRVPLAIIPGGTGNDFAKVVPGARTRRGAYDVIARPAFRDFDAGFVKWSSGSEFFVNGMGTGIDVEVVRQILRLPRLPGPLKYLLGLFRALAVYRPVTLRATLAHDTIERSVMMFAIGNGVCQGGGFYLTPQARPDDGMLELCVVQEIPLWKVALVLPLVLRGTHTSHPVVTMRSFKTLRFDAIGDAPLFFQLDGELREPAGARWLEIEVRPAALEVAVAQT
ncbi:MAG TPA: diacylglycerol kinase family protein [Longimicrobiales bacterium]